MGLRARRVASDFAVYGADVAFFGSVCKRKKFRNMREKKADVTRIDDFGGLEN